jgi:hypothetical protein
MIGVRFRQALGIFIFTTASRPALGPTQPPILWVPDALSLGIKLTTHLHLVQRSRNAWSYTTLPQYVFIAWCLVKFRHNTTFTYLMCFFSSTAMSPKWHLAKSFCNKIFIAFLLTIHATYPVYLTFIYAIIWKLEAVKFLVMYVPALSFRTELSIALGYGLDDWGSRVRFPVGAGNFSLHYRVQNGSGAHPASYPIGTEVSFRGGKAAGAWSWPLTSI